MNTQYILDKKKLLREEDHLTRAPRGKGAGRKVLNDTARKNKNKMVKKNTKK